MVSNSKVVKGRVDALGTGPHQGNCERDKNPGNVTGLGREAIAKAVLHEGLSIRETAKKFKVNPKTVVLWVKHARAGEVYDHRAGRSYTRTVLAPGVLSHLDTIFSQAPATNRTALALFVKKLPTQQMSKRSLRRAKKELGYVSRVRPEKPYLSPAHAAARLAYAQEHLKWKAADWERVMWTDETKGEQCTQGIKHIILKKGQQPPPRFHFKGKVSVMMWGGVSCRGKLPLWHTPFVPSTTRANDMRRKENQTRAKRQAHMRAKKAAITSIDSNTYINKVLKPLVVPFMKKHPYMSFVQDNAPCHGKGSATSQVAKLLHKNGIKVVRHPPNSPDLNVIEFVWRDCKQDPAVALCTTKEDIVRVYRKVYNEYPVSNLKKYCAKMPEIMKKLIETNGYDSTV